MKWISARLGQWSDWARGNPLTPKQTNPLADMIKRAAGEVPGRDLSIPYELTIEIEMTDKAVGRLREQNPSYKRVIMKYWMGHSPIFEIAREFRVSESKAKEMLMRAELQVGRNILTLEQGLTDDLFGRKIGSRKSGERAL
jgi:hypothetical protein